MMVVGPRPPNASQYALRMYEERITCWLKSNCEGGDSISNLPKENSNFCSDRHLPGKKEVARRRRSLFEAKSCDYRIVVGTGLRGTTCENII